MKIASVVGARPNFIKLAAIYDTIKKDHVIIHTGQHYDYQMSEIFFKEFRLPKPDYDLGVGSGSPSYQLGGMLKRMEPILMKNKFDLVLVYGDTNSTLAGALCASKLGIKVAHIESGLRSFDRRMPEETNRVLTDHVSDFLFAPTRVAASNLKNENVHGKCIIAGDLSVELVKKASVLASKSHVVSELGMEPKSYILFTMHRAENTDSKNSLISVIKALEQMPKVNIVFPIHPRTVRILKQNRLMDRLKKCRNVKVIPPLGYIDFVNLLKNASKTVTDSGGIQKEAYLLSVPCITIRRNTEWVETVQHGWNILTDTITEKIVDAALNWKPTGRRFPIFGNGGTSRIISSFIDKL